MSREISLFNDYHQLENSVTNYCGLMMKLIYEESPKKFQELLTTLAPDAKPILVGPIFEQQTKKEESIPDLSIIQKSFSIFFENKLTDWYYDDQIERHSSGFQDLTDTKVLFLLSNFETNELEQKFKKQIFKAKESGVTIQPISYEDFIGALENVSTTDYLGNLLDEFKIYLDKNQLLPKWKDLLDVVNCSNSMHEIDDFVYMCPNTGGQYSHQRAKYFGPYSQKKVSRIYEIDAVVSFNRGLEEGQVEWRNIEMNDEVLIQRAKSKIEKYRTKENEGISMQVFLLRGGEETNFYKDTSGGMWASKIYFKDIAKGFNSSQELADALKDKKWGDY